MPIHDYRHRIVRDLAWALLSPPLFTHDSIKYAQREQKADNGFSIEKFVQYVNEDYIPTDLTQWLSSIDKNPKTLIAYIEDRAYSRVGIYFEQLLGFFFSEHPDFDLLAHNLQIQGKNQTIGEFDFIVRDLRSNKLLHIETAVKFYLGFLLSSNQIKNNISLNGWQHWIGPNGKDTLSLKLSKMYHQQLVLKESTYTQEILKKNNIPYHCLESRLLLRGRFFRPDQPSTQPWLANLSGRDHLWKKIDSFIASAARSPQEKYCILPRSYWLSALMSSDLTKTDIEIFTCIELIENLREQYQSGIKTWQIAKLEAQTAIEESDRFFIIAD